MQSTWKKVGAVLGSAVMIGATLAGAALATDLGDYESIVVADGTLDALYVVGENAATADVVSAIGLSAAAGNIKVAGDSGSTGEVTLTSKETTVTGITRHVPISQKSELSYEFSGTVANDTIGPEGYASGDGVVDYLYSYKDKGKLYVSGLEKTWYEKVVINNDKLQVLIDSLESNDADKYDEVFAYTNTDLLSYVYTVNYNLNASLKGKNIWFLGEEYTVVSATATKVKLGSADSEIVLRTSDPTTTVEDVEVTLGGIYSVGSGSTSYKAKITVVNGGSTETKYITSTETERVAGIDVYVENAVVTTSGTNEGEAEVIVGAGLLELEHGKYLTLGDGTETKWKVDLSDAATSTMTLNCRESHVSTSDRNTVLYAGDTIASPNGMFSLQYNGLKYFEGSAVDNAITVELAPDLGALGGSNKQVEIVTPDGEYLEYTQGGATKTTDMIWVNVTEGNNTFWAANTTSSSSDYWAVTSPKVKLTTSKAVNIYYLINGTTTRGGIIHMQTPAGANTITAENITVEYNTTYGSMGSFYPVAPSAETSADGCGGVDAETYVCYNSLFVGRKTTTPKTRDMYTNYGAVIESVGESYISIDFPKGQVFGEYTIGTSSEGGTAKTVALGETATIEGVTLEVSGAVSGETPVALPSKVAVLDSEITSTDKTGRTLVLVGGPAVNTLVNELQTEGKLTNTFGSGGVVDASGEFSIELVADAFADGKYAIVVAGYTKDDTAAAADMLANFADNTDTLTGETAYVG